MGFMKLSAIILLTAVMAVPAKAEDLFVYEGNFLEFPNYKEIGELNEIPKDSTCEDPECLSFVSEGKRYFKTFLLNQSNYEKIAIGDWSGGDCEVDLWSMDNEGNLRSHYPLDGEIYSWEGTYKFTDQLYLEDAINNDGEIEKNEAKLYYLPKYAVIIYKGTRSLESIDEQGKENYIYYEGPDFFYFKKC